MIRLALAFGMLLQVALGSSAAAQPAGPIDYDGWESLAHRVERVLELDRAPDQTLERLRGDVAAWRELFLEAQQDRSLRITTLERQLDALGPVADADPSAADETAPPVDDLFPGDPAQPDAVAPEPPPEPGDWVTERRADLLQRLREQQVPNIRAAEAFAHADGLVRELDGVLRQRKADVVFARGPTPLNPLLWPPVLTELENRLSAIPEEAISKLGDEQDRMVVLRNLPLVFVLASMGIFLLVRGRRWTASLSRSARQVRLPVLSYPLQAAILLIDIALPWFGLVLVLAAINTLELFGPSGEALSLAIRQFGLFAIIGTAFVQRLFGLAPEDPVLLGMDPARIGRARRLALILVYLVAIGQGVGFFLVQVEATENTQHFTLFPVLVILGYFSYRFFRLHTLSSAHDKADNAEGEQPVPVKIIDILARFGMLVSVLGPLAASAGFHGYAVATLMPAMYTVFAMGLASFFSAWLRALYGAMRRRDLTESDLAPTIIEVSVYALLIPVLALIWGARITDLTEVWNSIREGFRFGDVTISPVDIAVFIAMFAIFYGLTRLLQAALRVSILPKTNLDIGSRTAIVSGLGYIGVFLSALVAIRSTGLDLSSLAIVAGALSVGIGFGLQTIVSNFVSGIILLIERPISEGDWIDVNGQQGYVRAISVRSTRIETFDRTDVIVPNSDLIAGTVTNWTRGNLVGRVIVPVGVAYGNDTARIERILREIAEDHPMVLVAPPPAVLFMGFGADALEFEIRAILRDVNFSLSVKSDLNHAIARRFVEEEIEIPFAQRDLWLRNPEVLRPSSVGAPSAPVDSATDLEMRAPRTIRDDVYGEESDGPGEADGGDAR